MDFDRVDMNPEGGGYRAVVPGDAIDPAWDLMLFFELFLEDGRATRWPDWRTRTPWFANPVE